MEEARASQNVARQGRGASFKRNDGTTTSSLHQHAPATTTVSTIICERAQRAEAWTNQPTNQPTNLPTYLPTIEPAGQQSASHSAE